MVSESKSYTRRLPPDPFTHLLTEPLERSTRTIEGLKRSDAMKRQGDGRLTAHCPERLNSARDRLDGSPQGLSHVLCDLG